MTVRVSINKSGFRVSWKPGELPLQLGDKVQLLFQGGEPTNTSHNPVDARTPLVIMLGGTHDPSIGVSTVMAEGMSSGAPMSLTISRNLRHNENFPAPFGVSQALVERHTGDCLCRLTVTVFPPYVPKHPSSGVRIPSPDRPKRQFASHVLLPTERASTFTEMRTNLKEALAVLNQCKDDLGDNVEFRVKEDGKIGVTLMLEL